MANSTSSSPPESIPNQSVTGRYHPVNLLCLPDDRQLPDAFTEVLFRLDAGFECLIDSALTDATKIEGWNSEIADRFMTWVYLAYRDAPEKVILKHFPKMTASDLAEAREQLICEANDMIARKDIQRKKAMPYDQYLETEHWQQVRKDALRAAEYRCQLCNAAGPLHVHHRTYERRGEESPADVIALCAECHKHFHDKLEVQR